MIFSKIDKNMLKFKNFRQKLRTPYAIYADIECVLLNPNGNRNKDDDNINDFIYNDKRY